MRTFRVRNRELFGELDIPDPRRAPQRIVLTTFDADDHVLRALRAGAVAGADRRRAQARDRLALLDNREREVAVAVGQGKSNAEISATLYLSVPTVETQVSSILSKLDFNNNRVQIALLVHDAGLLDDQH